MQSANNNSNNLLMLGIVFAYALYSFGVLFFICEFAQRGTDAFNQFDELISQSDWYLYPMEIQTILPVVLNVAQKPSELYCFGSIACNRESFKNVSLIYRLNSLIAH